MTAKALPWLVARAGEAIYGRHWRSAIACAVQLNPQTVRKIGKAAATGESHPVSPGVLEELAALAWEYAANI
ncbi:MAG: hypothetical protein ABI306_11280 [Caulobacteraceae bacterium]